MKVLLVNSNTELLPNPVVPLGACFAASAASKAGHETRFLDLAFEKSPRAAVERALAREAPDVVGVSIRNVDNTDFLSPQSYLPAVREDVVRPCLERLPERTVLGGAGFSTMPAEILEFMGAPAGVVGDAEIALPALLARWKAGRDPAGLPGVAVRDPSGGVRQGGPDRPEDLDAQVRSGIDRWADLPRYASFGGHANLQTKRGCPLRCAYCVYNLVEGRTYRFRSPGSVAEELKALSAAGAADAEFTDSTFNIPLDHAKRVLAAIEASGSRVRLHTSGMNPLAADEDLFRLMKRAGFASIMISAESASDRALEGLRKGYGVEAVHRMLAFARTSGFSVFWYFLFGGPGETEATVEESLRFIEREIPPHHLVFLGAGIRIQRGAAVEAVAREEGVLEEGASLLEPRYYLSPALDRERLLARLKEAVLALPNTLQVVDYQNSKGPLRLAWLMRFLGFRRPAWTAVPFLNRWLARIGRKRR